MAKPQPADLTPTGPVPAANQPGHHPDQEQDKPHLDDFAAKLSVNGAEPGPLPNDAAEPGSSLMMAILVGFLAAVVAAVITLSIRRRQRG